MYMYMAFTHLVHKLFYKKTPIACEQIVVKGHVDITWWVLCQMYMKSYLSVYILNETLQNYFFAMLCTRAYLSLFYAPHV